MNRRHIITLMIGLVFPIISFSQTDIALDPEFGGRLAVSLDKRITRGLHVSLEEEVRFDQNFSVFDRFHTTLRMTYKVHPNIKLGLGYALINGYSSTEKAFKDANAEGTKLKSYTKETGFRGWVGAKYEFAF